MQNSLDEIILPPSWYISRYKALRRVKIEVQSDNSEIYKAWIAYLSSIRDSNSIIAIKDLCGINTTSLQTDLKLFGITRQNQNLAKDDGRTFKENPYECVAELFSYDDETGEITRLKALKPAGLGGVGHILTKECAMVREKSLSLRQIVWLLHHKKEAKYPILLRNKENGHRLSNLKCVRRKTLKSRVNLGTFDEYVTIRGVEVLLTVDPTKPKQPKTEANKMRISGVCRQDGLCEKYVQCGDEEFAGKCTGYIARDWARRFTV